VEILAYSTAFRAALASTAEVQAGTDTLKTVTPATMQAGKIIQGTAVATTSGTTVDFTGIPTWAKRVTLLFNGVSTNGTNNLLVQIGSGSIQTSGYLGTAERMTGAVAIGSFTTGFGILSVNNTTTIRGQMTVLSFGSNTWIASHTLGDEGSNNNYVGAGSVTLSGALDRIRLTSVGGTDTFDAGSVNVIWE
jgi:hypothetical protein